MKLRQLEAMLEVEKVDEDAEVEIRFPKPSGVFDSHENIISVKDVSFAWPGEKPLFTDTDFCVGPTSRMAVLGKNGCGE